MGPPVTAYSFTGPRALRPAERDLIVPTVDGLAELAGEPALITTGGASGWDMGIALAALDRWPAATHAILLPHAPFDAAGFSEWKLIAEARDIDCIWELAPAPPPGSPPSVAYRLRNELLVASCRVLVAGLKQGEEFYRSGEWMTVNIARSVGKTVHVVDLSPVRSKGGSL